MSKIPIGGIIKITNLTMVKILAIPNEPGAGGKLLTRLGEKDINLHFIAESEDINGTGNITVCVDHNKAELALDTVNYYSKEVALERITAHPHITSLTIYGPHFREKPAISGTMCAALGEAGINILGISTSISSICCLIHNNDYKDANRALLKYFKLP